MNSQRPRCHSTTSAAWAGKSKGWDFIPPKEVWVPLMSELFAKDFKANDSALLPPKLQRL